MEQESTKEEGDLRHQRRQRRRSTPINCPTSAPISDISADSDADLLRATARHQRRSAPARHSAHSDAYSAMAGTTKSPTWSENRFDVPSPTWSEIGSDIPLWYY